MLIFNVKFFSTYLVLTIQLLGYGCNIKSGLAIENNASTEIFKDSSTAVTSEIMGISKGFYVKAETVFSGLHHITDKKSLKDICSTRILYDYNNKSLYIAEGTVFSVLINIENNLTVAVAQTQVLKSSRKLFHKRNTILEKAPPAKSQHASVAVFTATGKGIWKHGCNTMATLQQGLSFAHAKLVVLTTVIPEYLFEEIPPNGTKLTAEKISHKKHFDRYTFSLPPPQLSFICQDLLT
jgi:hypothetical protein